MSETTTATALEILYTELRALNLKLDLTRGKPSPEQLDLSTALLGLPGVDDYRDATGTDVRNYGGPDGLPELRTIFSELLSIPVDQLLALGNASLEIMYNTFAFALLHGVVGGDTPWRDVKGLAVICPTPGYDRHFAICESLGIRMIAVELVDGKLDLDAIRSLVATDASIRGLWTVPLYANPSGATLSADEIEALVSMPTAAPDFRLFWDNAYAVHHLTDDEPQAVDVLALATAAGNPDRPYVFASTSKITLPGAGVAFFGSSPDNIAWYRRHSSAQTIGPDKINQLRHVRFLKNAEGVRELMRKHRAIAAPRFAAALQILQARLAGNAQWSTPTGGYFINLEVADGTAREAIRLAAEIGVSITPAGSAFPYLDDTRDSNIRIAPTFPSLADLEKAIDALCTCVLLAAERAK